MFNDWYVQVRKGGHCEELLRARKMLALFFSDDPGVKILMGRRGKEWLAGRLSASPSFAGLSETKPLETAQL